MQADEVPSVTFPTTEGGARHLAAQLEAGDILCVRTDASSNASVVRRLIRFGQNIMKGRLSTPEHRLELRHARVVHVAVIGKCDPVTGAICVTEAASVGTRAVELTGEELKLAKDSGVSYEVYRVRPLAEGEDAALRAERIRKLAARHMCLIAVRQRPCETDALLVPQRPLFKLAYSKLMAIRAIFFRAWGRQAAAEKVIKPLLKEYSRFVPKRELPWNTGKVRSQMCSSLTAVRMQLAEFDQAVIDLEVNPDAFSSPAEHERFSKELDRIRHPDFPTELHYMNYLHKFSKAWAELIYEQLRYMPLNTRFTSPMELSEHLESSPGFDHVLSITAPGNPMLSK